MAPPPESPIVATPQKAVCAVFAAKAQVVAQKPLTTPTLPRPFATGSRLMLINRDSSKRLL
jgi:hypothetical protein